MGIEMRHTEHEGVVVEGVFPGSPAASAGLQAGDRLVSVGEQSIARPADVVMAVQAYAVGQSLMVKMLRAGQQRFARLVLVPKPDSEELMRSIYVGRPAPSISSLQTVQGTVVPSFAQLQGKPVVLEFWATWCVACRAMAPTLNRWHDELSARGVRVMAVTAEAYEDVALALPQLDMRYPVFVDATGEVIMGYRASALPTVFLIDGQGVVRDVMVGYDPTQLEAFRQRLGELVTKPGGS
jgi:thiol-disulfide isomerase/thioredoxin